MSISSRTNETKNRGFVGTSGSEGGDLSRFSETLDELQIVKERMDTDISV